MQLRSQGLNWRDQILWFVTIRLRLNRHSKVLEQLYLAWRGREEQFSVSERKKLAVTPCKIPGEVWSYYEYLNELVIEY